MKLLTFVFVVQFIIACWPKIDIICANMVMGYSKTRSLF